MRIWLQPHGLKKAQGLEGIQALIAYDDAGNPIYVGNQVTGSTIVCEKAGGPGFQQLLGSLGVRQETIYKKAGV